MVIQVTDVKKTLGSVYRMNQAGNMVFLDGGSSHMVHKTSGRKTPTLEENGHYVFYIWVNKGVKQEANNKGEVNGNLGNCRYAALVEEEGADTGSSW